MSTNTGRGTNYFPVVAYENKKYDYQNLCYGDVGIGYVLYYAGVYFENPYYQNMGVKVMENAAKFVDRNCSKVKDASLLYGAAGLYSIYKSVYRNTKSSIFLNASNYWLKKILEFKQGATPWAGYQSYYNSEDEYIHLSFSQGISGIGISLMIAELDIDLDFLPFFNYPTL